MKKTAKKTFKKGCKKKANHSAKKQAFHHGNLREALIESTLKLIDEKGVQGFTLADASRAAGVSRAAPYRHFAGKDQLLAAVAETAWERYHKFVFAGLHEEAAQHKIFSDGRETVRVYLNRYAAFAFDQPATARTLFGARLNKENHPELIAVEIAALGRLIDIVEAAEESLGRPGRPHAEWLARFLFLNVHGMLLFALDGHLCEFGDEQGVHDSIARLVAFWMVPPGHERPVFQFPPAADERLV